MYDASKISVVWGGRVITGFAEGSEVKITPNGDAVLPKVGLQGDVAYAKNADKSGTVTFSLSMTSAAIAPLRADARTATPKTLSVRDPDPESGFLMQAENCVVIKEPETARGKEITGVEITIFVPVLNYVE
jgi:hypothetical protein